MTRDSIDRLYTHMEWADCEVWAEVLRHEPAAADPFIRESLLHIHVVQFAYLTGWTGGTPQPARPDDFASLREMQVWAQAFYPRARDFLGALDEAQLTAKGDVLWPDLVERAIGQPPVPIALVDMIYQVVAHSSHHRAQVNRRLRELDATPPFIDYVAWAWLGDPAADWS